LLFASTAIPIYTIPKVSKTPPLMMSKVLKKTKWAARWPLCKSIVFYSVTERIPKDAASKTRPALKNGRKALEEAVGAAATLFSCILAFAAAVGEDGAAVIGKPWESNDLAVDEPPTGTVRTVVKPLSS
jgi:hypothetical protein